MGITENNKYQKIDPKYIDPKTRLKEMYELEIIANERLQKFIVNPFAPAPQPTHRTDYCKDCLNVP